VNPYRIEGPALISFSGGRTSGYMLWHILDAFDGKLPEDVHVCFANTGKEREETLRFVHECGSRWGVHIRWLEWRSRPHGKEGRATPQEDRFEEVGFNSASRNGEPFLALIERKQMLPNVAIRYCTSHLKVETMKAFMRAQGYEKWNNAVGLRADELRRVAKQDRRNETGLERGFAMWPMVKAGVTKRDVWRWWLGDNIDPKNLTRPLPQGFDLGLFPYEGNCDGCFLKGRGILTYQERERPGYLDWWEAAEKANEGKTRQPEMCRFNKDFSYAELKQEVARQPLLVPLDWREVEFDAECGVGGTDHSIRCGRKAA
jgi:3'-phosphoadenosine 5'-phosphosulfate sulfotransferase (PAPS reductase)/FAD synthetase